MESTISSNYLDQQLEALKKKYNLTHDSRFYINRAVALTKDDLSNQKQLAALITGFKNIQFAENTELEDFNGDLLRLLPAKKITALKVFYPTCSEETPTLTETCSDLIFFTPSAEHHAYMLANHILEFNFNMLKKYPLTDGNSYLIGTLLEYPPQEIEFYHKLIAFSEYKYSLSDNLTGKIPLLTQFPCWGTHLKEQFINFEEKVWPTMPKCHYYNQLKKEALAYLALYSSYSSDELYRRFKNLSQRLIPFFPKSSDY